MKVVENYKSAIENSDENLLKELFAPQVLLEVPAGPTVNHSANTASYIMSQVAKAAPGIKCTLMAITGNSWYFLAFEGRLEDQKFQAIDQVHLNKDAKIDQLIIYMRPISVAQKFAEVISQRLRPAS